ncbi:serine protease [bacterium]|nr:serine protease [bacterium]
MCVNWTRWLFVVGVLWVCGTTAAFAQLGDEYRPEQAVSAATALVRPSVVAVETRFDEPRLEDGYEYWQWMRGARPLYGLWGSGFIYKDPNYVITSEILMDHAEYVRVILDDGRSYEAELVGKDEDFDVAVLKVDWGPDLEPISPSFGDSDALKLGQPIAIVGKALNSVDTFATAGIISAVRKRTPHTDEPTDKFLQFDASYELSFTGAPLIDISGAVIGMVDQTVGTQINLGVPVNEIISIADKLIAGEVTKTWFGVEPMRMRQGIIDWGGAPRYFDWNEDGEAEQVEFGFWVSYVEPGSPADIAGIEAGDTIVEIDDRMMKYQYDWDSYERTFKVGQLIYVELLRKNPGADVNSYATEDFHREIAQVQILEEPEEEAEAEVVNVGSGYLSVGSRE